MKLWQRALVALLLLSALCGLFVHAALTDDDRSRYPATDELATEYDSHVGETVLVFGRVTAVESDTVGIRAESNGTALELQVEGAAAAVEPGGVVQVYGELRPGRTMTAQRVVVVNQSGRLEWYKYAVSAFGALGFLVAFFRHWRVDTETWTVEGRDG